MPHERDAFWHVTKVVMNHMANEFFFDGHEYTQAPFRFHEDGGLREYLLQVRKTDARLDKRFMQFCRVRGSSN